MARTAAGVISGVVAWMVFATAIGLLVGQLWPAFAVASRNPPTLTVAMLALRLAISFVASIVSGAIAARVARDNANAAVGAGVLLLLWWGTYHVAMIWDQFPVWYHLTFFVSLPLLSWIGARFAPLPRSQVPA
jgi:hypothetical protein